MTVANPDHYPGLDDPFPDHPFAGLLPRMTVDELNRLILSIETYGQLNPIVLFQDKILDGRNRYAAIVIINKRRQQDEEPLLRLRYGYFERDRNSLIDSSRMALEFVQATNFSRRSLTAIATEEVAINFSAFAAFGS